MRRHKTVSFNRGLIRYVKMATMDVILPTEKVELEQTSNLILILKQMVE
jgi:hypothetical protein